MAAIDKIYAGYWENRELAVWCIKHKPSLLENMYNPFGINWVDPTKKTPISNFSHKQDRYLYWYCPLDFVREYLETQCGYKKANWFVKLFWKR